MNKFDVSALKKYAENYDEKKMWSKIKDFFFEAGINLVIKVVQLWYVLQKPEVPVHVKVAIMGDDEVRRKAREKVMEIVDELMGEPYQQDV